nr:UDP-N-acetylmuramoyl-L-alanine--D-glutamate ligase [Candidatus Pandoraea novymonadis]
MVRWCARYGCGVRVADIHSSPPNLATLLQLDLPEVIFIGGAFTKSLLDDIDLIGISPGLSPNALDVAPLLVEATQRGIPVWGEIEFFSQALNYLAATSGYAPKLLAITGTNGKTTTTRLTELLCCNAGKRTAVAGNISPSALDCLSSCISEMALPDIWILELSSFQLETTYSLKPDAAAILNITQDHLDWHGGMDAYVAAKARIFSSKTMRVLNRDDVRVMKFAIPEAKVVTFGTSFPDVLGDFGLQRKNGVTWLVEAFTLDDEVIVAPRHRNNEGCDVFTMELGMKWLMPADALRICGEHNAANALAALALTRYVDLPLVKLVCGLGEYTGELHRVQLIGTIKDVEYYDDSKGTNVGATAAAISGLKKQIVLIAGGDGKGQDFSPLVEPVANRARAVFLIGRDALKIRAVLAHANVPLIDADTLEAATFQAAKLAQPGDAVLLSPACASFDMFQNYEHRADVFRHAVLQLATEAGEML